MPEDTISISTDEEIIKVAEEDVKYLEKLTKRIGDTPNFISILTKEDEKLYKKTLQILKKDTNEELTQTEYLNLASLIVFCDKFEKFFYGLNPSEYDVDLFESYRKAKNDITLAMRDYRKDANTSPASIEGIKRAMIEIEGKDGSKIIKIFENKEKNEEDPNIIEIEEEKTDKE